MPIEKQVKSRANARISTRKKGRTQAIRAIFAKPVNPQIKIPPEAGPVSFASELFLWDVC